MYIQRKLEPQILLLAKEYPVITLVGPRQSGKTTLARHLFPDYSYINLEDPQTRTFATEDINGFFKSYGSHLILDEIQNVPTLLSKIQVIVDENEQEPAQFILTASQELKVGDSIAQSLAGRTSLFTILPFSMAELTEAGIAIQTRDKQILHGFMPRVYQTKTLNTYDYYRNYIATYVEKDVKQITAIQDELVFHKFLTLLSGRVGNLLNYSSLSNDLGVAKKTIERWISLLKASHIIYLLQPWFPSRTSTIVKTPKLYFHDTGVVSVLLGIETENQMLRDPLRGNLFENMVVMEALKQRVNINRPENLYFFKNSNGLEVDLLFQDQRLLVPYEIKSSETFSKDQFANIAKFRKTYPNYLDTEKSGGLIYAGNEACTFLGNSVTPFQNTAGLFLGTT